MGSEKTKQLNHLAIIMDGNGRWAQARNLPRSEGHRAGADNVLEIVKSCRKFNIKYLTLYAFSTENWKRPAAEVNALMLLLGEFIDKKLKFMQQENIRFNAIGRLSGLPESAGKKLLYAMEQTRNNSGNVLTLALNYGGRPEIADAARKIALAVKNGTLDVESIDEAAFGRFLYDPELPDPDLVIRTSGELRLSNFLLWQMAYSELYVTDVLWPDFKEKELQSALQAFAGRDRRFGGVNKA